MVFTAVDYDTTIDFYAKTLALTVHDSWDDHGRGTIFDCADGQVEVIEVAPDHADPPSGVRVAYEVDDAARFHDHLLAEGVAITQALAVMPWGHRSFGVTDPNGVEIICFERLEGAS